ncbi:(d)CMP kinase [Sphingobacterium deserti]|uniref:Cytidylate kinase n=1 Tax=Sphingobacterium deserti TaxID=1229276 RepID=A0A0B8T144_9SPHI|nr:(d)CMP kinase [Sphingobacterium deserti]KGE14321.1 cytidylate kinase [Sphingobacterium deserti]
MKQHNFIIAIDGYSACGKSTVAKLLASKLNFLFVDSGALYRAVTLFFIENNVESADPYTIQESLNRITLAQTADGLETLTFLNERDVSSVIRQMEVSNRVSKVSALREVRQFIVNKLQEIGRSQNLIMDGRDIGTVVFPNAHLKIFMDARPEVRARRRYAELLAKGEHISLSEIMDNLLLRDRQDTTREESPLVQAHDAYYVDTSDLTEEEVLAVIATRYGEVAQIRGNAMNKAV